MATKPLPLLTFMNEWFWTSGQDGVLNLLAQNGWTITPITLP